MTRRLIDYTPDTEFELDEFRRPLFESEAAESVFSEADELDLATELLDVQSQQELDLFLGDLIARAGNAIGAVVRSPTGQALGGVLKDAARLTLPVAGRAIGGYLGGSSGAARGAQAAAAAGRIFGLELEGLSPEDRELHIARSFVRFAGETVRSATTARKAGPPRAAAHVAAAQAARRYAPGLLRSAPPALSGRWVRRNRNIVVVNS